MQKSQALATARSSNFELLRILLMLLVVANHLRTYGGLSGLPTSTINIGLLHGLCSAGKTAVNGFVLLSGWFMCTSSSNSNPKKWLKYELQLLFWSLGGYVFCLATGLSKLTFAGVVQNALPILRYQYWYAVIYFFLLLAAPFLNQLIRALPREQHRTLLWILFIVFCAIPTVFRVKYNTPSLVWFFFLYLLAAYLRLYAPKITQLKWSALAIFVASYSVVAFYKILLSPYFKHPIFLYIPKTQMPQNSFFCLAAALGLLLFFSHLRVRHSKCINTIAGATFGVYLLHEHPGLRQHIWGRWFSALASYQNNPLHFLGRILFVTFTIFAIGIAIELLRQRCLEAPLFRQPKQAQQP